VELGTAFRAGPLRPGCRQWEAFVVRPKYSGHFGLAPIVTDYVVRFTGRFDTT